MLKIIFHGRGGQGALTAARILAAAFLKEGKYALVLPEFKSERRSAPIAVFIRVDEKPIILRSKIYNPDYLVILDPSLLEMKQTRVLEGFKKESGIIILAVQDSKYPAGLRDSEAKTLLPSLAGCKAGIADVDSIANKYGLGQKALPVTGAAILGVFSKITNLISLQSIIEAARESDELPKKEENIKAVKEAFEQAKMIEFPALASDKLPETEISPVGFNFQSFKNLPESVISLKDTKSNLTGSWRRIRFYYQNKTSSCQDACPLGNDIPYWLELLEQGKIQQAWEKLTEKNPLPAVTGRVCPAFCEQSCNRKEFDEPVSIRSLEKFLGDTALARGWHQHPVLKEKLKPFHVAVIGSGPAGLSCAYQLARRKFRVTVFEKLPVLGGQLRFGIPESRLPKDVLEREIANIIRFGIKVNKGIAIDSKLFEIIKDCYDAIFIASGLQKSRKLGIEGEKNSNVFYGLDFLKDVNLGQKINLGKKVIVIGGGNVAIDAARTAKSLGSEVAIFYRRTRIEMPAIKEDVISAEKEGIEIKELLSPIGISRKFGRNFLKCQKNQLGECDESGRKKPLPINGSDLLEQFDDLIIAVGEEAEDQFFYGLENDKNIFLGGDIKTEAGTVAAAIGSGREAAENIERFLLGKPPLETKNRQIVKFSDLNLAYFQHKERKIAPLEEAERCFSCGVCDLCGNCWKFCPHLAVSEKNGELKINYDYCKGCGVCAQECPRSVISQKMEE